MKQLFTAIYNKYKGKDELTRLLTGGLHNLENLDPNPVFPFGVFQLISATADHFASNKNYLENCLVQFNIFSKELKSLCDVLNEMKSVFDFCTLVIDDYTSLSFVREMVLSLKVEDVWQYTITYRVMLEP